MNDTIRIKLKSRFKIIYIIWSMFLFSSIITMSTLNTINIGKIMIKFCNLFCKLSYLGFVIYIFTRKKNKKTFLIEFLILILGIIIDYSSRDNKILHILILIIMSKYLDFKKLAKISLIILIFSTLLIVFLAMANVIPNYEFIRENKIRYACGFIYVSMLPGIILEIIFFSIYLNQNNSLKMKLIYIFSFIILIIISFFITNSRTQFYEGVLLLIGAILRRKIYDNKIVIFIAKYSFVGLLIFSMVVLHMYGNNSMLSDIDKILVGRISLSYETAQRYNIKPFGNEIQMYGTSAIKYSQAKEYFYIDNLYIQLLYKDGYIISLLACYYIYYLAKMLAKEKTIYSYLLIVWIIAMNFSSLLIDCALNISLNMPIMLAMNIINKKNIKNY